MDNAPSWMRYPKKMGRGKAWFKFILLRQICSKNLSKKVQFSLESLSDKNQCFLKFLLQQMGRIVISKNAKKKLSKSSNILTIFPFLELCKMYYNQKKHHQSVLSFEGTIVLHTYFENTILASSISMLVSLCLKCMRRFGYFSPAESGKKGRKLQII